MSGLSFENQVFRDFAFHGTVVLLKMGAMSALTGRQRFKTKTFISPEDFVRRFGMSPNLDKKIVPNENVERVRRNHLNDLENIPLFILIGLFYVASDPDPEQALLHFRIFTATRFLHTIAYQLPIRQPARALTFLAGFGVTVSMAVSVLRKLM